ncbi:uncharacterized protein LOC130746971 [Lotus japonicus]|uniref:uncharacterized protein LOC130724105 n=1 Tax=Lotus japonicus TaxID=34305 RepID=UPI00258B1D18|nr:uncharacterized protein LOC130724105 [Lotus japonicus]XP_057437845.1 uncharacterized protein LOC130729994 [Lotus japonicus]XP_057439276.1 uncharacterized protein LOC130731106 [Lotus japonicus]XP_057455759.1 uncharacterized protein LOC130746971 [Lotus japonicus]
MPSNPSSLTFAALSSSLSLKCTEAVESSVSLDGLKESSSSYTSSNVGCFPFFFPVTTTCTLPTVGSLAATPSAMGSLAATSFTSPFAMASLSPLASTFAAASTLPLSTTVSLSSSLSRSNNTGLFVGENFSTQKLSRPGNFSGASTCFLDGGLNGWFFFFGGSTATCFPLFFGSFASPFFFVASTATCFPLFFEPSNCLSLFFGSPD